MNQNEVVLKLRIGDLVEYGFGSPKLHKGLISTTRAWWLIKGHVEVNSCIVAIGNITKIITPREKLKDWWKWLDC